MLLYDSANFKDEYNSIQGNRPAIYVENPTAKNDYAYLTWRFSKKRKANNFKELGEGFFVSAIVSTERCMERSEERLGDSVSFPILFNTIHGIELYCKAILFKIAEYAEAIGTPIEENKIFGHGVRGLYTRVQEFCNSYSLPHETNEVIKQFLDMLFQYTDDVTFARYPYDKYSAEQFFVSFSGNIALNLENYHKWCGAVFYGFDMLYINICGEIERRLNYNE